ncbi:Retrovirus-related Pol polyprotein from transposon opus [Ceratobasidium sp. AG-Ba]|nr:Retrovirus-related Pol polyprotein from transposon opus [Ceratobasidium sp. AG-Ba]
MFLTWSKLRDEPTSGLVARYEAFCRDRPNHWATLAVVEHHNPEEPGFDPARPLHVHALTISQERKGGWNTQNARFWDFEGNHPNILQKELRDGPGGNPARDAFNYLWKHVGEEGEEVEDLMAGDLTLERLEEILVKGRGGKRSRQQAELEDGEEIVGSATREEFYQAYKRLRPLDMTKSWNSIRAYAEYTYKADAGLLPAIPVGLEVPEYREHVDQADKWFAQEVRPKGPGMRHRILVIEGETGTGKTAYARSKGSHSRMCNVWNVAALSEEADIWILGDMVSTNGKYLLKALSQYEADFTGRYQRRHRVLTQTRDASSTPLSISSILKSIKSSPTLDQIPFPPSPAFGGYEPDSDLEPLPKTPVRPRPRRSSLPAVPKPSRIFRGQEDDSPRPNSPTSTGPRPRSSSSEDEPAASPSTVICSSSASQPAGNPAQPLPTLQAPSTAAPASIIMNSSSGSAPPSSGNAATSAPASSHSAVRDAMLLVQKLGPFSDGNSPMPKAKYRHHFKQYTFGLTDEETARVWVNKIEYASPAHMWYCTLTNTPTKAKAVEKWPDLELEIETQWPTPQWDDEAHKTAMQDSWDNHFFEVMAELLARLKDWSNMTKPHQVWAEEHRALGKAVNSTNEDRVSKTIAKLPPWLVNMLPKGDRYSDRFDELMNDVGALSSRQILYVYEREAAYEVLTTRFNQASIAPQPSYPKSTMPTSAPAAAQGSPALKTTPRRSSLRFASAVQQTIIPLNDTPPEATPRALPLPPSRNNPPHMTAPPSTPQTPAGPISSVISRVQACVPLTAGTKVDDSLQALAEYAPFPLSPGSLQQTLNLCPKCGVANHTVLECQARTRVDTLDEYERKYRESLQRSLSQEADNARRAGTQPATPTPPQRFPQAQAVQQVEFSEGETDFESVAGSSGKEPADAEEMLGSGNGGKDMVRTIVVEVGSVKKNGDGREWPFKTQVRIGSGGDARRDEMWATVDGGSMLCVLDHTTWALIEHSFGSLRTSGIICRMANGACVPSKGTGVGVLEIGEMTWPIRFKVIDSKGAFELLLGKDWLRLAGAKQIFATDTLSLVTRTGRIEIKNGNPHKRKPSGPRPMSGQTSREPNSPVDSRETTPGEPVPRRSARLKAKESLDVSPFWVAKSALLELERVAVEEPVRSSVVETEDALWQKA